MSLGDNLESVQVTGVVEYLPPNTHLQFDYLVPMPTLHRAMVKLGLEDLYQSRRWAAAHIYVLLRPGQARASVESKLPDFTVDFYADGSTREEILSRTALSLQPITDIHLHSKLEQEISPNSDIAYVYIFSAVALFVLLVAGVNFVNISTALALKRMREVGIRKVLGARMPQLIWQFLGESLLLTSVATLVAVALLKFSLPLYNGLSGKSLDLIQILTLDNIALILLMLISIGTLAGLYPALFISRLNMLGSLKGLKDPKSSAARLRKGLVILQFAVSIFMIFSTTTMYRQMTFFRRKALSIPPPSS